MHGAFEPCPRNREHRVVHDWEDRPLSDGSTFRILLQSHCLDCPPVF